MIFKGPSLTDSSDDECTHTSTDDDSSSDTDTTTEELSNDTSSMLRSPQCDNVDKCDSQSDILTSNNSVISDVEVRTEARVKELVRKKIVTACQKESMRQRKRVAKKKITPSGRKNYSKQKQKAKLNDFWDY